MSPRTASLAVLLCWSLPASAMTCQSMWALDYATAHGWSDCTTPPSVPNCDKDEDGDADDFCSADEMLQEIWEDPFYGEKVSVTGGPPMYPGDKQRSGNLIAAAVPACADGSSSCPGQELRCVDGTRPLFYVDIADDPTSNDWLITFEGGGSCGMSDPLVSGGVNCWDNYQGSDYPVMTGFRQSGSDLQGPIVSKPGAGVLASVGSSNEFSNFHRILVHKCSQDRGAGSITRTDLHGAQCPQGADCSNRDDDPATGGKPQNGDGDTFNLPFHGGFIIQAILEGLREGSPVAQTEPIPAVLPDLIDAERIVIAAHSGGAYGLAHNLDRIAGQIEDWGGDTEVYGVFDAKTWPGLDHEASLTDGGPVDMYDFNLGPIDCEPAPNGTGCLPPANAADRGYSDDTYRVGGAIRIRDAYRATRPDDSCVADHAFPRRCYEGQHVQFNHLSTPFFARQAKRDSKHLDKAPEWADDTAYRWPVAGYTARVEDQARTFIDEPSPGRHCEHVYDWIDDPAHGFGFYYPNGESHPGMFDGEAFFTKWNGVSYHDALFDWLSGGDHIYGVP